MTPAIDTMPLHCSQQPLLETATAASADPPSCGASTSVLSTTSSTAASSSALIAKDLPAKNANATYTTPTRPGGMAAVTPSTLNGSPDRGVNSQENNVNGAEDVIASSAEEAAVAEISAASSLGGVACDAPNPPGVPSPAAAAAAAAAKKKMVSSANSATPLIKLSPRSRAAIPAPAIRLGPRVTPAIRKHGLQHAGLSSGSSANASPVKPRKLDTALAKKGPASKAVQQSQKPAKQEECPTTPPVQKIPPPSSFLACKISPLTSSAWKNGEKGKRNTVSMGMPPLHASSNLNVS